MPVLTKTGNICNGAFKTLPACPELTVLLVFFQFYGLYLRRKSSRKKEAWVC